MRRTRDEVEDEEGRRAGERDRESAESIAARRIDGLLHIHNAEGTLFRGYSRNLRHSRGKCSEFFRTCVIAERADRRASDSQSLFYGRIEGPWRTKTTTRDSPFYTGANCVRTRCCDTLRKFRWFSRAPEYRRDLIMRG